MSEEDKELERLKQKKLKELKEKAMRNQQQQSQQSGKGATSSQASSRNIVVNQLGYRGMEVLEKAEAQFPQQTSMIIAKIAELIRSGEIQEKIDGGQLLSLFRSIGMRIRIDTSIKVEDKGKFVSLSDKLQKETKKYEGDSSNSNNSDTSTDADNTTAKNE